MQLLLLYDNKCRRDRGVPLGETGLTSPDRNAEIFFGINIICVLYEHLFQSFHIFSVSLVN